MSSPLSPFCWEGLERGGEGRGDKVTWRKGALHYIMAFKQPLKLYLQNHRPLLAPLRTKQQKKTEEGCEGGGRGGHEGHVITPTPVPL